RPKFLNAAHSPAYRLRVATIAGRPRAAAGTALARRRRGEATRDPVLHLCAALAAASVYSS
ncbi:MAG TPA: hypothetical protein VN827_06245, partial [Chthoniobacterales bacterium]|nr:hypothetical protein [Chthoniobacterales bacterium]